MIREGGKSLSAAGSQTIPLITMVTATFNAVDQLPHTLASIRQQTFLSYEWIVIDGGSTDGTVELLGQHEDLIDYWLSEPDRGIYDAWNKACAHARGQWILFIGAGDELGSPTLFADIKRVLETAHPRHDLVYGKAELLSPGQRVFLEELGGPWEHMQDRWEIGRPAMPPHPAVFHHRSIITVEQPFDTRFRIAADALLLLKSLRHKPPLFVPMVVNRVPSDGVSTRLDAMRTVVDEVRQITHLLGITAPVRHRLSIRLQVFALTVLHLCIPRVWRKQAADLLRVATGRPKRWTID